MITTNLARIKDIFNNSIIQETGQAFSQDSVLSVAEIPSFSEILTAQSLVRADYGAKISSDSLSNELQRAALMNEGALSLDQVFTILNDFTRTSQWFNEDATSISLLSKQNKGLINQPLADGRTIDQLSRGVLPPQGIVIDYRQGFPKNEIVQASRLISETIIPQILESGFVRNTPQIKDYLNYILNFDASLYARGTQFENITYELTPDKLNQIIVQIAGMSPERLDTLATAHEYNMQMPPDPKLQPDANTPDTVGGIIDSILPTETDVLSTPQNVDQLYTTLLEAETILADKDKGLLYKTSVFEANSGLRNLITNLKAMIAQGKTIDKTQLSGLLDDSRHGRLNQNIVSKSGSLLNFENVTQFKENAPQLAADIKQAFLNMPPQSINQEQAIKQVLTGLLPKLVTPDLQQQIQQLTSTPVSEETIVNVLYEMTTDQALNNRGQEPSSNTLENTPHMMIYNLLQVISLSPQEQAGIIVNRQGEQEENDIVTRQG